MPEPLTLEEFAGNVITLSKLEPNDAEFGSKVRAMLADTMAQHEEILNDQDAN